MIVHPDLPAPPEPGRAGDVMPPGHFLATVGRELWEPMSNMMSMTGFLMETDLTRDQREMVAELRNSGEKLLRLIQDTLDAVGVESGHVQMTLIPFDLRVLADDTVALLRVPASKQDMSVEGRVHHEVPSRLVGDPGRLRQVLWNLCKHAIEANASGGVVLRVGRLHEDPKLVTLRFEIVFYASSLMGKAGDDHPPGSQKPPDSPVVVASEYMGLQLEIARRLVGVMGAQVVVEGEPGRAHHTWFDLTLEKQQEVPCEEVAAAPRAGLAGQRVLVVDPTEAIRHALVAKLGRWGCRMTGAAQGDDAMTLVVEAAKANDPFRFVLIDRDLPRMSAHDLGTRIRAEAGGEPLHMVLLATVGCRGDLERARACGFDAYLPKATDWHELGDALVEVEHMALTAPAGEDRSLVTRHWLAEVRRSRTRILIVEDDVVSVLVTDWTLRRIGYQVVRVDSASELRRLLNGDDASFDLVILALRLPDADGLSLAPEIRAATRGGRSAAIVALGYECTRVERDRCRAAGVDAYVPRPVDLAHLCEVVEQITRTSDPSGPEVEALFADGEALPASHRKSAADRDRIAFRFEVDLETGAILGDGRAVRDAVSALGLDAALVSSVDIMAPEIAAAEDTHAEPDPMEPSTPPMRVRPADEGSGSPLDLVRLDQVSMKNPALRHGLLENFLRQARAALDLIGQGISTGDAPTVESESHRLSQMSEAVGATPCREVFSELENLGREGSVAGAASLVERASSELDRVERAASVLSHEASTPA